MEWVSFLGATALAAIHLLAGKLRFLDAVPRSRWLSFAGGVAVAYAIVHLMPELHREHDSIGIRLLWSIVLLGVVLFYGLEKLAARTAHRDESQPLNVFWMHIAAYAAYNALLGYLLIREDRDLPSLGLYLFGIGLHFVVNDHSLRQHHQDRYCHEARWLLAIAVLSGWLLGLWTKIDERVTAAIVAFLAGGIILNTFKEELPESRESRYWVFAVGALGYAALLLMI